MTPERWRQIEEVVHRAFEHTPDDRQPFVEAACGADLELRAEVETLLASAGQVHGFLETSALEDAAILLVAQEPAAEPGERVGPYAIEERLGAGGMGEVFLAHDIRLGRKVALKLLDRTLIADRGSRARFLREARMASSLDHPNICTVYEVGEADDRLYIAMQYVDGQTLERTVAGRALAVDVLLRHALDVAEALGAAHSRGIVHRDVKGSNILVTADGRAIVLDFGIATLLEPVDERTRAVETSRRDVIGTPTSMSPEQARGERVDHRSDLFSFGVVLYQMATGVTPFRGRSGAAIVSAMLTTPHVPADALNPSIPPRLSSLIDRALAKDSSERYQSARELIDDLRDVAAAAESPLAVGAPPSRALPEPRSPRPVRFRVPRIAAAVAVALLLLAVGWVTTRQVRDPPKRDAAGPTLRSLAVLPFKPLVEEERDEALEMGMADTLIAKLSAIRELDVRPISAVRQYNGLEQDAIGAGREQRVDAVLDGQIQRAGGRFRVTMRLLRVADGRQLWAEQFDEQLADIFSLQDSVSARVSAALAVTLSGDERRQLTRRHTRDVKAYQLYVLGRYYLTQLTDEGFRKALDYFERAAAEDRDYALAYAGIAEAYLNLSGFNAVAPRDGFPKARAAAETALRLDDGLAEAHAARAGAIFSHDWDWAAADLEFRRALELNPNAADAHTAYGFYLSAMGRRGEALREMERALELDPISAAKIVGVADVLYMGRRYPDAEAQYRRALEMVPDFGYAHWALGRVLMAKGEFAAAAAAIKTAIPLSGDSPDESAELARAYALSGRPRQARELLGKLQRLSQQRYVAPTTFAVIFAALGETDRAFEWLERAWAARDFLLVLAGVEPMFDPLRGDPRFDALLARMEFASLAGARPSSVFR